MQLDRAVAELEQNHLDGLVLPEPYPTMAVLGLKKNVQFNNLGIEDTKGHQSALAFNSNFISADNQKGLREWLDSIARANVVLEEDISKYEGAQIIITQQQYFGFEKEHVHEALAHSNGLLIFETEKIPEHCLKIFLKQLISLRLLLNSITLEDLYLDPVAKN